MFFDPVREEVVLRIVYETGHRSPRDALDEVRTTLWVDPPTVGPDMEPGLSCTEHSGGVVSGRCLRHQVITCSASVLGDSGFARLLDDSDALIILGDTSDAPGRTRRMRLLTDAIGRRSSTGPVLFHPTNNHNNLSQDVKNAAGSTWRDEVADLKRASVLAIRGVIEREARRLCGPVAELPPVSDLAEVLPNALPNEPVASPSKQSGQSAKVLEADPAPTQTDPETPGAKATRGSKRSAKRPSGEKKPEPKSKAKLGRGPQPLPDRKTEPKTEPDRASKTRRDPKPAPDSAATAPRIEPKPKTQDLEPGTPSDAKPKSDPGTARVAARVPGQHNVQPPRARSQKGTAVTRANNTEPNLAEKAKGGLSKPVARGLQPPKVGGRSRPSRTTTGYQIVGSDPSDGGRVDKLPPQPGKTRSQTSKDRPSAPGEVASHPKTESAGSTAALSKIEMTVPETTPATNGVAARGEQPPRPPNIAAKSRAPRPSKPGGLPPAPKPSLLFGDISSANAHSTRAPGPLKDASPDHKAPHKSKERANGEAAPVPIDDPTPGTDGTTESKSLGPRPVGEPSTNSAATPPTAPASTEARKGDRDPLATSSVEAGQDEKPATKHPGPKSPDQAAEPSRDSAPQQDSASTSAKPDDQAQDQPNRSVDSGDSAVPSATSARAPSNDGPSLEQELEDAASQSADAPAPVSLPQGSDPDPGPEDSARGRSSALARPTLETSLAQRDSQPVPWWRKMIQALARLFRIGGRPL